VRPAIPLLALALAGCLPSAAPDPARPEARRLDAAPLPRFDARPAQAAEGCWAEEGRAARVETVEVEVVVEPAGLAPDGTLRTEPLTRTETRRRTVAPAEAVWFETPCPGAMDAARIATLQRALAARGFYEGPATGAMDTATGEAIRAWQAARGLDSATLSLAAARRLGVLPVALPAPEPMPEAAPEPGAAPQAAPGGASGVASEGPD